MDRTDFAGLLPGWSFDNPIKLINSILLFMGLCNIFLTFTVLQATALPNLGVSPSLLVFFLCVQNALTWFTFNRHRTSHLEMLVPNDFVIGCLLGISIGGSIIAFTLSQFFGQLKKCSIEMHDSTYDCKLAIGKMGKIWFWSGLVFWLNIILSILIVKSKHELSNLQEHSYEDVDIALQNLQSNFQHDAANLQMPLGDGTFFGKSPEQHEAVGDAQFPMTPSQELASVAPSYGVETGFDNRRIEQARDQKEKTVQLVV